MLSPYPLLPTLRLPFDYACPLAGGRGDLCCAPLAAELRSAPTAVTVVLLGDLMRTHGDHVPRVDARLRAVISGAELVVGNCEGPVSQESWGRRFSISERLAPEYLTALLSELGIEPRRLVLSVANNHSGDAGRRGLDRTLAHLADLGVAVAGLASAPMTVMPAGDIRVGVAAWTAWMNREAFDHEPGVARTEHVIRRRWEQIRGEERLDCLLGFPHWDFEFRHFPNVRTRALARRLLEQGFDLLAGHHPHVLQPIETSPCGVVAYSLGNLTGPALPMSWPMRLGGALELRLGAESAHRGRVLGYRLHPCVQAPGTPARLVTLDQAPEPLHSRAMRRLRRLFPHAAGCPSESARPGTR